MSAFHAEKQPYKSGTADDCHENSHRKFIGHKNEPCDKVAEGYKSGADDGAEGEEISAFVSDDFPYKVGDNQSDKSQQPGEAYCAACEKSG